MNKYLLTLTILITTNQSASAITRINCFSKIHQINIDGRVILPAVSPRDCLCTDQGIFCRSGDNPIKNLNLMANCTELDGKYEGEYCLLPSGDWKNILLIEKQKPQEQPK